ncbi:hypothetical protein [Helicobacter mehlei]|uniref:hypothetical protein n=1 Tax=Helicobacter mehlei TaxID=2316080 RepID=UPI002E26F6D8
MTNDQRNQHRKLIGRSLKHIRKAHDESCLSIFAGAGISAGSGLPSWEKLIDTLKENLRGSTEKNEDYLIWLKSFLINLGRKATTKD